MKKQMFEEPQAEVLVFDNEDAVIATSGGRCEHGNSKKNNHDNCWHNNQIAYKQ